MLISKRKAYLLSLHFPVGVLDLGFSLKVKAKKKKSKIENDGNTGKGNMENRDEPNEKQAKQQGKHRNSPPETLTKNWGKFGKLEILKNH